MKKAVVLMVAGLMGTQAFGAEVKSARLDASRKNILVDVTYGGGCGKHEFSLKLKGCFETLPVRCKAELVEKTNDGCEALLSDTVVLSLEENGLSGTYFKGGSLTIYGDTNWQTNERSSATVQLPR